MSVHYIIDGYNLIKHRLFSSVGRIKDERLELVLFIRNRGLCGSVKNKITIVFDGYPREGSTPRNDDNLSVIYSEQETADERIKMIVERSRNPKIIIVVSDDRQIQFSTRNSGASVMGIEEFIAPVRKAKAADKRKAFTKVELNYSQMHAINEEMRKIWLKQKK